MLLESILVNIFVLSAAYIQGNVSLSPKSVDEWENTDVTLTCSYEGQYKGLVHWNLTTMSKDYYSAQMVVVNGTCKVNHGLLSNADQYSYSCTDKKEFNVTLKRISHEKHGEMWTCIYDLGATRIRSNTVKIYVKVPVKISTISPYINTYTAVENSTVSLLCATSQVRPEPSFRWYIDNDTLSDGEEVVMINSFKLDMPSDIISNYNIMYSLKLNRKMNGRHLYCGVSNRKNTFILSKQIFLNITYPPEVMAMNSTLTVIEGDTVAFLCPVKPGNPNQTIVKWTDDEYNRTWNSQQLVIENVSRKHDLDYKCTVFNNINDTVNGYSLRTMHLNVLYIAEIKEFYIEDHSTSEVEVTVNETNILGFICQADGNPNPTMVLKKGQHIMYIEKTQLLNYTLRSSCRDRGTYICIVNNTLFNWQSPHRYRQINITVNCSPRPSSSVNISNITNITTLQERSATLSFSAVSHPSPVAEWFRQQNDTWKKIEGFDDENIVIVSSSLQYNLTFKKVSHQYYGQYRLVLKNSFGVHIQNFNFNPTEKPTAPSKYGYNEGLVTEQSITIWWQPEFDGGFSQQFIISYRRYTHDWWLNTSAVYETDDRPMSQLIRGLESGTRYHVLIYAENRVGSVRVKEEIIVETKASMQSTNILVLTVAGTVGGLLAIVAVLVVVFVVRKRCCPGNTNLPKTSNNQNESHPYQNFSKDCDGSYSIAEANSALYKRLQNTESEHPYQQIASISREGSEHPYQQMVTSSKEDKDGLNMKIYENLQLSCHKKEPQVGESAENVSTNFI